MDEFFLDHNSIIPLPVRQLVGVGLESTQPLSMEALAQEHLL